MSESSGPLVVLDTLIDKTSALAAVNEQIIRRIQQKEGVLFKAYSYQVSSTCPVTFHSVETRWLGAFLISQWKSPESVLVKSERLSQMDPHFDYSVYTFDDVVCLNAHLGQILTCVLGSFRSNTAEMLLKDLLENFEKLQVALGQIEGSLGDQADISAELESEVLKMNQDHTRLIRKANAASGFALTRLTFDVTATQPIYVQPYTLVKQHGGSSCRAIATTIINSGITSWQTSIRFTDRRYGSNFGVSIGVFAVESSTSTPPESQSDSSFYGIFIPTLGTSASIYRGGHSTSKACLPAEKSHLELITAMLDLQSCPNAFSLSSPNWETNITATLPTGMTWRPVFIVNTAVSISL